MTQEESIAKLPEYHDDEGEGEGGKEENQQQQQQSAKHFKAAHSSSHETESGDSESPAERLAPILDTLVALCV